VVEDVAVCRTPLLSAPEVGSSESAKEKEKKGLFDG